MGSESETTIESGETFSALTWLEGTSGLPMLLSETDVTGDRPESQSDLIASSRLDLIYCLCVSFIAEIFVKLELRKSALPLAEFGRSEVEVAGFEATTEGDDPHFQAEALIALRSHCEAGQRAITLSARPFLR
jgi:hypothetical protein